MIDPITALAGIQSAVALIKKVSSTIDDVSSLGPILGKYFDAKSKATTAAVAAKNSGDKSSMAIAIEIEMTLLQTAQFEKELQMLFMQTGNIDVWNKIKERAQSMDRQAAQDARRAKEAAERHRKELQVIIEWSFAILFILIFASGLSYFLYQIL